MKRLLGGIAKTLLLIFIIEENHSKYESFAFEL